MLNKVFAVSDRLFLVRADIENGLGNVLASPDVLEDVIRGVLVSLKSAQSKAMLPRYSWA